MRGPPSSRPFSPLGVRFQGRERSAPTRFPPGNSFELAAALVTSPSPTKTPDAYVTDREPLQMAKSAGSKAAIDN